MTASEPGIGPFGAHELLKVVSRLKEVRRRFVREAGDGDRFDHAEQRLDSVIRDLERALGPGGHRVELGDLELRLAAVEEMIEGLGFPKYAHVLASVRGTLTTADSADAEDKKEPPAPRRFEPPPGSLDKPRTRAPAPSRAPLAVSRPRGRWRLAGLIIVLVLVIGLAAALNLGLVSLDQWISRTPFGSGDSPSGEVAEPSSSAPATEGAAERPTPEIEAFRVEARALGQVVDALAAAETSLAEGDIDEALRRFAVAAEIDRHHRGVVGLAVRLIDALLVRADQAFDDARWELAAKRVDDARHLASGLYLDTTEIEQVARRHAALTRFHDLRPTDTGAIQQAVGRAIRVTMKNGDELFGELDAFQEGRLVLSVYSGVHGGGVQFESTISLSETTEIRVYQASRVSELIR
jgi:hypothetical protein